MHSTSKSSDVELIEGSTAKLSDAAAFSHSFHDVYHEMKGNRRCKILRIIQETHAVIKFKRDGKVMVAPLSLLEPPKAKKKAMAWRAYRRLERYSQLEVSSSSLKASDIPSLLKS